MSKLQIECVWHRDGLSFEASLVFGIGRDSPLKPSLVFGIGTESPLKL